jgi:hypothetical protein
MRFLMGFYRAVRRIPLGRGRDGHRHFLSPANYLFVVFGLMRRFSLWSLVAYCGVAPALAVVRNEDAKSHHEQYARLCEVAFDQEYDYDDVIGSYRVSAIENRSKETVLAYFE